jgi:ABC-2 type transport system permease protein
MNRIFVVAKSEFLSLVRAKFFLIGLLMMPVLVGTSIAIQVFAARQVDHEEHQFAVIDRTGVLYAPLAAAAEEHNQKAGSGASQTGPHFVPRQVDLGGRPADDVKIELSGEIKAKKLFAVVEIPETVIDINATDPAPIAYYTETASYQALPDWLQTVLSQEISARRFTQAAVDPKLVAKLTKTTRISTLGLMERGAGGEVIKARKVDGIETFAVPFGLMYLLFLAIMTSLPQLMNAVLEEKMSRISEVLVSSVTPIQLMAGKLLGTTAVSTVLALFYLFGGSYALLYAGRLDALQPQLIFWFLLFLVCAVLMYGSLFVSIGAAASDIKDAQGLMQPAMIMVMLPILLATVVIQHPDSGLAVGASLFPTTAPFLMLIRLALKPGPPFWQLALSVVITLTTAVGFVWAAGRIFRVGLLMQGKGATLPEMIRWIWA